MPVFFDESGKRWRIIRLLALGGLAGIFTFASYAGPKSLDAVEITSFEQNPIRTGSYHQKTKLSPNELGSLVFDEEEIPIIGAGPLLRVVRIEKTRTGKVAVEPFNGQPTKVLTETELNLTRGNHYAIERYGHTEGKRIVLTFDDGPDPVWTPQVLNLLSEESVPATFFAIGENVTQYPELSRRITNEGHLLANHTFSHIDLMNSGDLRGEQDINQAQRVIRATTNQNPAYFRIPYGGNFDQEVRDQTNAILKAQKLGYIVTNYHIDTKDWQFNPGEEYTLPEFNGGDQFILLHDAGGDRSATLAYLKDLIIKAKDEGYSFATVDGIYPRAASLNPTMQPSFADEVSIMTAEFLLVWPARIVSFLFYFSLSLVLGTLLLNTVLAALQLRKQKDYKRLPRKYKPLVSILVPSYNEDVVLEKTIKALLRSNYKNLEIIIVDDGSSDNTWEVAARISDESARVLAIHQENRGKAHAISNGLTQAKGEIVAIVDADTIFAKQTIGNLVRHFSDPEVGGVAGSVKIGNADKIITKWQVMEYAVSINLERSAQAMLNAITVVPGACGAWRREALEMAGGFSSRTLAEDCDLTLSVQKAGYRITQDSTAVAYTEAPDNLKALIKQRFRWVYGNIQSFWHHRDLLLNRRQGWLGLWIAPYTVLNMVLPFIFLPITTLVIIENTIADRYWVFGLSLGFALVIETIGTLIALRLAGESLKYAPYTLFTRLIYSPVRIYLLFRSAFTALRGIAVGWNKLQRMGTANLGVSNVKKKQLQAQLDSGPGHHS